MFLSTNRESTIVYFCLFIGIFRKQLVKFHWIEVFGFSVRNLESKSAPRNVMERISWTLSLKLSLRWNPLRFGLDSLGNSNQMIGSFSNIRSWETVNEKVKGSVHYVNKLKGLFKNQANSLQMKNRIRLWMHMALFFFTWMEFQRRPTWTIVVRHDKTWTSNGIARILNHAIRIEDLQENRYDRHLITK
jgi:hypothetical protein